MSALTESAARRHFERHLRAQGIARDHVKKLARELPIAEVRRALPLWRRLQAAAGRMPSDSLRDPEPWRSKGSEGEQAPCRHQKSRPLQPNTAPTQPCAKRPEMNLSRRQT